MGNVRRLSLVGAGFLALGAVVRCTSTDGPAGRAERDAEPRSLEAADAPREAEATPGPPPPRRDAEPPEWGATPIWEPLGDTVAGCTVERLKNPAAVRAFRWVPCADAARCEEGELNPALTGGRTYISPMSGLDTSSGRTRVRLELLAEVRSVLADEDGACILAFQARMGSARCATFTGAVLGNRLAVQVSTGNAWHVGAVLVDLSTPAAYRAFDLDPVPPGANAAMVLSETRLAWQFVPNDRLISVALDGTDQRIFAGFTPDVGGLAVPVSTGSHFLFDRVVDSTAPPTADIGISDGTAEQQPLLGGPDAARAGIAYANGRIAWQVGRDRRAVEGYSFGRVELWTSPFSPRASELSPRQVATLDGYHGFSKSVAGAGRYVTFKPSADPNAFHEADVWDLETGARETLRVTGELRTLLGVSPGHVWLHTMNPEQLLRFAIP